MSGRKKRKSKILDDLEPDLSLQCLPSALREKLMPFQREGVKFALKKNGRCLIGDEMGLGKTLQAIAVAYHYRQEWPVLVVVPSSLRYQWVEELERWVPDLEPTDIHVVSSRDDIRNIATAQVTILGYGLIQRVDQPLMKALHDQNFQVIIVDESHYLKNRQAVRTKGLVPLVKQASRALLLTGTPALARPAELFPQVDALLPGKFGTWTQFSKRYCNAHRQFFGRFSRWDTNGASNLAELHSNLQPLMIRRLKAQVLTQLPPKRRQRIPFDVPEGQHKKELDKLAGEWRDLIGRGAVPQSHDQPGMTDNPSFLLRQLMVEWYHTTALAKAGSVQEYIKVLLENESMKFIVFGHHKHMLQAVTQTLIHSKVKYIRIDGSVPSAERTHLVQQFQGDPSIKVAVLSILAAGTGLTLTAASHVVFAELYWTPGVLEQAEDRAHRIGQHNSVHVHYLVARNTIDDWMWSMLTRKVSVVTSTLNGKLAVLHAEECDKDQAEFLSRAAVWLPGEQQEEDDSFFFTQPNTQKDLRSYFKPKGGRGQNAQPSDKQKSGLDTKNVSLIQEDDDDDADFRDVQKAHRSTRSDVFVIDSDSESTTDENEMGFDKSMPHLESDRNMLTESDASSSCDTIIQSNQNVADISSLIGQEEEIKLDVATPNAKRNKLEDTSSVCEKKAEDSSSARVEKDVKESGWGCSLCTFHNHALLKFCEMCETPRKKGRPATRSQHDSNFSSPTSTVTKESKVKRPVSSALGTPDTKPNEGKTVTAAQKESLLSYVKEKPCFNTPVRPSAPHSTQNTPTIRSSETPMATSIKKSTPSDLTGAEKVSNIQNNNTDVVDLTTYSSTEEEEATCNSDTTTEQTVAASSSEVTESQTDSIPKKTQSDIFFSCTPPTFPDLALDSSIAEDLAVAAQVFRPSPCRGKSTWRCENSNCGYSNADSDAEDCDACFSPRPRKRLKLSSTDSPQGSLGGTVTPSLKTAGTKGTPSRDSDSTVKPVEARSASLQRGMQVPSRGHLAGSTVTAGKSGDSMSSTSKIFHSAPNTPSRKDTSTGTRQGGKPTTPQFLMKKRSIPVSVENTRTPPPKQIHKNLFSPCANSPASGSISGSPLQGSDWFDDDDISDDMLLGSEKSVSPRGHLAGSTGTAGKSGDSMYDLDNFSMNADIGTDEGEADCGSKDPVVKLEDIPVYEELQFCASMHTDRVYLYDVDDQPLSCNFSVLDVEQRNMDCLPDLLHQPANWRLVLRMVQEWNRLSEPKKRVVRRSGRMFISPSLLAEELSQSQRRKAACKNQRFMSKEDFMQRAFKVAEREGGTVQVVSKRRPSSTVTKPGQHHTSSNKPSADSTGKQQTARLEAAAASSSDSGTAESAAEDSRSMEQQAGDETRPRGQLQVVDSAGRHLCLWCQKPVTQQSGLTADADLEGASSYARQHRYCSTECKEEYRIRMQGGHSRQQLRDTEFGVCQICETNVRQIFLQVKELPMSERKVYLKSTLLSSLPVAQLNKIVADPKEGQFWHADHIVPVADGGGLCSLDNFRTLCVMCHRKVTQQQNRQRRVAQKQERRSQDGYRSIMDFIKQ
ncbi:DNA annealing helicase and endonuclease ZRANB3-like [Branchiostoma lanceolatum]|uniref:DNA annealing helicase and endonuclease ZRANB3-like n=1 Tax=Branchiostoma lanceolatum TaxID=7740 RepID=UPI003452FABA